MPFHPGFYRQPLVGVGGRHGKPGIDLHECAAARTNLGIAQLPKSGGPAGGRNPSGEEVGAEGEQEVGVTDIQIRQQLLVEDVLDRGLVGGVSQGFKSDMASTEGLGESAGDGAQGTAQRLGYQGQVFAPGF